MNLPNKLTMLRIAMIPLFLLFVLWEGLLHRFLWAFLIFGAASITDTIDGWLARSRGIITDFGKFMDPLADKVLVMAALVAFVEVAQVPSVIIIIILARELLVTALRLLAADSGVVIAADSWGKMKTIFQMCWICYTLLFLWGLEAAWLPSEWVLPLEWLRRGGMAMMVAVTVMSGVNYLRKNCSLLVENK